MIKKCYVCGSLPKYTYFTNPEGARKTQMFCRNCHNHGLPKNSDPEAVKSWNDNNDAFIEQIRKHLPALEKMLKEGSWS